MRRMFYALILSLVIAGLLAASNVTINAAPPAPTASVTLDVDSACNFTATASWSSTARVHSVQITWYEDGTPFKIVNYGRTKGHKQVDTYSGSVSSDVHNWQVFASFNGGTQAPSRILMETCDQ